MAMQKKLIGIALSGAAALAFITGSYADGPHYLTGSKALVRCYGINSCRGQSTCRITTTNCKVLNNCKGQNACRGKGYLIKHAGECLGLGGTTPDNPDALKNLDSQY